MKLADVNLLVALADNNHPHHSRAKNFAKKHRLTTCPITELGLLRITMQLGASAADAFTMLEQIKNGADFVPCDVEVSDLAGKVSGHRQSTDVYLLQLAKAHQGKLYTLDAGIKGAEMVS